MQAHVLKRNKCLVLLNYISTWLLTLFKLLNTIQLTVRYMGACACLKGDVTLINRHR